MITTSQQSKSSTKPFKPVMKMIRNEITSSSKNYVIRPQSLFRSPLSRILSDEFKDRDQRKMEITTHCNYGFNYDTIRVYASILDRLTKAHEISESQEMYSSEQSGLFRLNDGIPLQFGGFSPCLNTNLLNISPTDDFQNGNSLFQYFVEICYNINPITSHPLLEFIRSIYKKGDLKTITEFISSRIEDNFKECMQIIRQRNKKLGIEEQQTGFGMDCEYQDNFYEMLFAELAISQTKKKQESIKVEENHSESNNHKTQMQPYYIGKRARSYSDMQDEDELLSKAFQDDKRKVHFKTETKVKEQEKIIEDLSQKKVEDVQSDGSGQNEKRSPKDKKQRRKDKKRKISKYRHTKYEKDRSGKSRKHKKEKKSKHRRHQK